MSIDPLGPARPVHFANTRRTRDAEPSSDAGAREAPRDRIDLSDQARQVAAAETPEERAARIEALRAAVSDGTYRVDADAVAGRIVDRGEA